MSRRVPTPTTRDALDDVNNNTMSATDANNPKPIDTNVTRLSYYHLNPSYTVRVICCVLFIFLTEICLSHYIYRLINAEIREEYVPRSDIQQKFVNFVRSELGRNEITKLLKEIERDEQTSTSKNTRRKRGTLAFDENFLNVPNDGQHVEFFNSGFRPDVETRDEKQRKPIGGKGVSTEADSWVVLNISRVPVSKFKIHYASVK